MKIKVEVSPEFMAGLDYYRKHEMRRSNEGEASREDAAALLLATAIQLKMNRIAEQDRLIKQSLQGRGPLAGMFKVSTSGKGIRLLMAGDAPLEMASDTSCHKEFAR